MKTEKSSLRKCELNYYPNDKTRIEQVFRHVRGKDKFKPFWDALSAEPDICYQLGRRRLYRTEKLYEFFQKHGFANYFEKQRLKSWEEVVFFIEDRRDYYSRGYELSTAYLADSMD